MQSQHTVDTESVATLKTCPVFLNTVHTDGEVVARFRAGMSLLPVDYIDGGLMNDRLATGANDLKRYKECDNDCFCPRKAQRV